MQMGKKLTKHVSCHDYLVTIPAIDMLNRWFVLPHRLR